MGNSTLGNRAHLSGDPNCDPPIAGRGWYFASRPSLPKPNAVREACGRLARTLLPRPPLPRRRPPRPSSASLTHFL